MKSTIASTVSLLVLASIPALAQDELALGGKDAGAMQFRLHVDKSNLSGSSELRSQPELMAPEITTRKTIHVNKDIVQQLGQARETLADGVFGKHYIVPGHSH